ncbi:sigma D regulator [Sulfuriflexus sp.]|uniref:sigma D regulator n=1 Tax=Sulfuriflexus sp. TaxID=2015443 RepID=UPI0028CE0CD6|nr:Rsd/AlgQ family anti-sigma factor [Sulfuriflexus sp.]MDT8403852.1 Rsd/AlgQ family anti-sigma factor [Sulfuriflexus sp.]
MEVNEHNQPRDERRTRSNNLIDQLKTERAEVLVNFCRVAGIESYKNPGQQTDPEECLRDFCQIMVDYLAAGHFGLYQRVVDGNERRQEISELAAELYPEIAKTTQFALDFNDKYEHETEDAFDESFSEDLSRLGEALATRIELEDRLLQALK